jgi:MFS transporter, ACDE family, multidrug resistance protein
MEASGSDVLAIGTRISSLGQFLSPVFLGSVGKTAGALMFYLAAAVAIATEILSFLQVNTAKNERSS